jgi:hypothetical protein
MVQTASPPTSTSAKIALGALVTLAVVIVVALSSALFGQVAGEEFNPYTFQRRRFYYFEIPLIHIQVWPLVRSAASGTLEEHIETNKYVVLKGKDPEEWHLMSLRRSAAASPAFDAAILRTYLEARDSRHNSYWSDWSTKHANLAALLWPAVARCAQLNLYIVIPQLFDLARSAEDVTTFQKDLNALQLKLLLDHAQRAAAEKDHEAVVKFCDAALEIDATQTEFINLRSTANQESTKSTP